MRFMRRKINRSCFIVVNVSLLEDHSYPSVLKLESIYITSIAIPLNRLTCGYSSWKLSCAHYRRARHERKDLMKRMRGYSFSGVMGETQGYPSSHRGRRDIYIGPEIRRVTFPAYGGLGATSKIPSTTRFWHIRVSSIHNAAHRSFHAPFCRR